MTAPLLSVRGVHTYYGRVQALKGLIHDAKLSVPCIRSEFLPCCVRPIPRVFRDVLPKGNTQAVRVVIQDLAADNGHRTLESSITFDFSPARAEIGKLSFSQFKHGNIRRRADAQRAEFRPVDHPRRIHGCATDDIFQRHSQAKVF